MDKISEEIIIAKDFFNFCKSEFERVLAFLNADLEKGDLFSRKIGMIRHAEKMLTSFEVLYKTTDMNCIASLLTLHRMIVDNYSIFYLLTKHSTEAERDIRYNLYLQDGVSSRSDILINFKSVSEIKIGKDTEIKTKNAITNDAKASEYLDLKMGELKENFEVSPKIIDQKNWKFKYPKSSKARNYNSYTWFELYKIARIPDHHAQAFQKYLSAYTHGLAISLFKRNENDINPFIEIALYTSCVMQSIMVEILLEEHSINPNDIDLDENFKLLIKQNYESWKSTKS